MYRRHAFRRQHERFAGFLPAAAGLAALALTVGACTAEDARVTAATGPADADAVRLYALDCGRIDLLDLGLFDRGGAYDGRSATVADPCFLIRHPQGDLLWDTGVPDAVNAEPDGLDLGPIRFSMPRTLASQLAELGLDAGDIDYLALSHSHLDHTGNAGAYASATWLVDSAEREFMFREEARADAQSFPSYAALENAETIEFTEDHDVFGDGMVTIVRAPGHTPGHCVLLVRLANSGPVLLSGDLYHLAEARTRRTIPGFNTDADETLRSMDTFEALAATNGARVIVQHDPEHFAALPTLPAYLD